MATVTRPPTTRPTNATEAPRKRVVVKKPVEIKQESPEVTSEERRKEEELRRDGWFGIVVLAIVIAILTLMLWLASLGGTPTEAPPSWTDWPMM